MNTILGKVGGHSAVCDSYTPSTDQGYKLVLMFRRWIPILKLFSGSEL